MTRNYLLRHARGFTLLEVLVALVILGLSLALLSGAVLDSVTRAERVTEQDRAAVLADAILAELGEDQPARPGLVRNTEDGFNWVMAIAPAPDHESGVALVQVSLDIYARSGRLIGEWRTLHVASP